MKIPVRRIDPADLAEIGARHGTEEVIYEAAAYATLEMDPEEPESGTRTGADHRLRIGIALMAAVIGLAIIGRLHGDVPASRETPAATGHAVPGPLTAPAGSTDPAAPMDPFVIVSPADGATVQGTTVEVHAVASRALGTVYLAVMVGYVTVGDTHVEVAEPGAVDVSIPVFAPPVGVQIELVARIAGGGFDAVRRALWLDGDRRLGLWPTRVLRSDGHIVLVVSGYAPLAFARLTVRATTPAGKPLGVALMDVRVDSARPGSSGGSAFSLGSFEARVNLPAAVRSGPVVLSVDWRDLVTGDTGTGVEYLAIGAVRPRPKAGSRQVVR